MDPEANQLILGDGMEQVYDQLRALAAGYLKRERRARTLQPTALVHEALLSLMSAGGLRGRCPRAVLIASAKAMRHVLVDHARRSTALKRGGRRAGRCAIEQAEQVEAPATVDLVALNEVLMRLGALDPELLEIVELRFFGGLSEAQIASHTGVSTRTVTRAWAFAKRWLAAELMQGNGP